MLGFVFGGVRWVLYGPDGRIYCLWPSSFLANRSHDQSLPLDDLTTRDNVALLSCAYEVEQLKIVHGL